MQAIKEVSPRGSVFPHFRSRGGIPLLELSVDEIALRRSKLSAVYSTVIGLYFGTRTFIRLHAMRYAIPQKQNMMK